LERQYPSSPDIVAIGASAGGIEAASRLLSALPRDFPAAVLLVLHRTPNNPSQLARVIGFKSALPVEIAEEGSELRHGICYIAPTHGHLTIMPEQTIHLLQNGFYRGNSIDVLFSSLARCAGPRTIGVVLSGMLKDGTLGLKSIKEAGGAALVQEPAEASFPDMPRNAIAADGPVDFVGPVDQLAREIRRRVGYVSSAVAT
jgi:two-component system chemotaxis response regulator CheB